MAKAPYTVDNTLRNSASGALRTQRWNLCEVIARMYYQAGFPDEVIYSEIKSLSLRVRELKLCNKKFENSPWK